MATISYVVPVYNNQGSIRKTWEGIRTLYSTTMPQDDYEVIFVDDGSRDGSYAEMQEVSGEDPKVKLLRFTRNFGQVPAIIAGYEAAQGDAVINISADLQDPVELTSTMVEHWRSGSQVVVAFREDREDSFGAKLFSRLAYGALRASNKDIPEGGFDFVLMGRKALGAFLSYRGRNRFYQGDILWAGFPTTYIPYVRRKREVGRSQYTFSKKLKLFFDFILDGSYLPIRLMSLAGLLIALSGIAYAAVIVIAWFSGLTPFSGWAPLMIALLLLSGTIMLMLGLIGEYLWRILDEVKAKPLYMIQESPKDE